MTTIYATTQERRNIQTMSSARLCLCSTFADTSMNFVPKAAQSRDQAFGYKHDQN